MVYDELAESLAMIRAGQPPARQSWKDRDWVPMAFDAVGDLAVTAFAHRRGDRVWHEVHVLTRRDTGWKLLGGGSGSDDGDDLLAPPPAVFPATTSALGLPGSVGGVIAVETAGGTHDDCGKPDRWPWSGRWISWAEVRVAQQVTSLQVRTGRGAPRDLALPWHGRAMVVWTGPRSPRVQAHDDGSGRVLAELRLPR